MWSRFDLKVRLTLQVAAVLALCFAAISAFFLLEADKALRTRLYSIAAIAAKTLELQQSKMQWVNNPHSDFPDLHLVATSVMMPGLCLAFRTEHGEILQRLCGGAPDEGGDPPKLFSAFYRRLFDPGREVTRPVVSQGETIGEAVVWVDGAVLTAEAWREAGRMMAALAIALPMLSVLVYAALARALRPTQLIRAGLQRIAANDLTTRLPPFDLAELSAIRDGFNHLAESLGNALAERNELTRRLIALQDDERLHLARELHDEFGQSLTAIRALAASIRQSAAQDCPALLGECDGIARTATDMTETLRGALFRLRPPDIDELGLAASLEGLIAGWNGRLRGRPRFEIGFSGSLSNLPPIVSANLYRIVQEALTNAARHAGATRVATRLQMRGAETTASDSTAQIELDIDDDGEPGITAVKSGMGLLGMRERVAALGGRLTFEAGHRGGSALRVVIPIAPVQAVATECAA
jgi:signal transduction histidine kinase